MILEERNYSVYSTPCLIRTLAICLNFLQQKVFQNNFVRFFSNPILIKCILAFGSCNNANKYLHIHHKNN